MLDFVVTAGAGVLGQPQACENQACEDRGLAAPAGASGGGTVFPPCFGSFPRPFYGPFPKPGTLLRLLDSDGGPHAPFVVQMGYLLGDDFMVRQAQAGWVSPELKKCAARSGSNELFGLRLSDGQILVDAFIPYNALRTVDCDEGICMWSFFVVESCAHRRWPARAVPRDLRGQRAVAIQQQPWRVLGRAGEPGRAPAEQHRARRSSRRQPVAGGGGRRRRRLGRPRRGVAEGGGGGGQATKGEERGAARCACCSGWGRACKRTRLHCRHRRRRRRKQRCL